MRRARLVQLLIERGLQAEIDDNGLVRINGKACTDKQLDDEVERGSWTRIV